ncbi:hypothetical protein [Gloeobacter kilaueensis]|uniref:hypothetical protein n=1 Tax=Gloeobacter kilaueensis TaxID=1416614 RepID=UPI0016512305|nr:hypothetical protein [Gloeobacter kilaueensis]
MKLPEVDGLLQLATGSLALWLEVGLRLAAGAEQQLLAFSDESKKYLSSRLLPELEE